MAVDGHTHMRDGNQRKKETLKHGLRVAYQAGLDGIFEMPNTDPPLTSREQIEKRIKLADAAIKRLGIKIFHGLYAGITPNQYQIEEVVKAYNELFPRVVGLKMFAGNSTGNMGIVHEVAQKMVYNALANLEYKGVLAVHCEKESLLKPQLWTPKNPISHCLVRPPAAEVESVKDQIRLAKEADFVGVLYLCHISVPEALKIVEVARKEVNFRIMCEITPHHALLYSELMKNPDGLWLKMNPPLRPKKMQEEMFQSLLNGKIDCIGTDHSPHLRSEKEGNPYASGIPGIPYYPLFIKFLRENGMADKMIKKLTYINILEAFGFQISDKDRYPSYELSGEYEFDPFAGLKS